MQDVLTVIAHVAKSNQGVDVFATGDAGIWATFAAAVSQIPVSLHLKDIPALISDADYLRHFNVPGIERAGGLNVANRLVESRRESVEIVRTQ